MKVVLFCGGLGLRMRISEGLGPQADDADRPPSGPMARHALLRPFRPQRIHSLPWSRCTVGKGVLPQLRGDGLERFRALQGRRTDRALETDISEWRITFADTGIETPIGERLRRVRHHLDDDEMFLANYGDVLTDAPLDDMVNRLRDSEDVATMLAIKPQESFHVVTLSGEPGAMDSSPSPIWTFGSTADTSCSVARSSNTFMRVRTSS